MLAITLFSVIPMGESDAVFSINSFKLTPSGFFLHLAAYLVASFLAYFAYHRDGLRFFFRVAWFIFLFSLLLEAIQIFIPYRTFNPSDIAANITGIGIYLIVCSRYLVKFVIDGKHLNRNSER